MSFTFKMRWAISALIVFVASTMLGAPPSGSDLLLIHGHVITVNGADSTVEAVAVRNGSIVMVGTDAEVLALASHDTGVHVIDLRGHTVTPGLIDTHAHIAEGGVNELYGVNLSDADSIKEILARVKAKIVGVKPGEWVTGSGWAEGQASAYGNDRAGTRFVTVSKWARDFVKASPNNKEAKNGDTGIHAAAS